MFCLYAATSVAQEIPRQLYQDSVLGWMKVYKFKGTKEPQKVDDKIYSAAQLSIGDFNCKLDKGQLYSQRQIG